MRAATDVDSCVDTGCSVVWPVYRLQYPRIDLYSRAILDTINTVINKRILFASRKTGIGNRTSERNGNRQRFFDFVSTEITERLQLVFHRRYIVHIVPGELNPSRVITRMVGAAARRGRRMVVLANPLGV